MANTPELKQVVGELDVIQINRAARSVGVIELIFVRIHSTPSSVSNRTIFR